jgi:hypothetical protein
MTRTFLAAVIAALVLPVLALAALIGEQERLLYKAQVLNVPLIGVDPRDLLRGRYIVAQFDWDWEREPTTPTSTYLSGALCVVADDKPKPRVRFIEDWKQGDRIADGCRMMIAGSAWPKTAGMPARFMPDDLDAGGMRMHIFVPEEQAPVLEKLIRDRPGALTVDLAVRADGRAAIKAVRVDGKVLGR